MSKPLEGKVALVTGGSRGIGAAIARRLAQDGAKVAVNYSSSKQAAEAVVRTIKEDGGEAVLAPGDVSAKDGPAKIAAAARDAFGRIDILVNNAGVLDVATLPDATPEHFEKVFAVNVFGVAEMTRAAAPHLPDGGRVINTSSIGARAAIPGLSAYIASKAAVDALTRSFAAELGPRGITVNAVAPGTTDTDMLIRDPKFLDEAIAKTPLGRVGQPADIAGTVAFLASADAGWVTGQVIDASGGLRV
ncbi:MAG TPA: glucose 1-dehydrogenase [Candidatus Angelobacter sp.]|nr:glucose 1-dehydrogenase [Candidatus Angelobacter sp.]